MAGTVPYDALAEVYDWLTPDALLQPEGSADAFSAELTGTTPQARVLDCAAGTGRLAVGLALRGFAVTATDASPGMIERTRALAAARGVAVHSAVCRWDGLPDRDWPGGFDLVLCVGNSLAHAEGAPGRRAALAGIAAVLRPGGRLVLTSRNWERLRSQRPRLQVADELVQRPGGRGLVIYSWSIPDRWEAAHAVDVAVAVLTATPAVRVTAEHLTYWPFPRQTLEQELLDSGLEPEISTYAPDTDRYLVRAVRV